MVFNIMEENKSDRKEQKTWNQQLAEWYKSSGKTLKQIKEKTGIPDSTLGDYIREKSKDINKINPERRRALYNLTGLEFFRLIDESILYKGPKEEERNYKKGNLTIEDKVSTAQYAFYILCSSLEELRDYPEAREELAKRLKQPIVGRLTSYLEGIYTDNRTIIPMIPKLNAGREKKI